MQKQFERTALLLGETAIDRLAGKRVAVFGIGGVGGYVVEALVRSGVGHLVLVDSDRVDVTNINRQIIATLDSVGKYKVDAMAERIASINPEARVEIHRCFFLPETADEFDFSQYDYVVDAVDTVTAKLEIIMRAQAAQVPVISAMGAGNKLDPARFQVADIYKTHTCPLAKVMRRELRKRGVKKLKVVYSDEEPICPVAEAAEHESSVTDDPSHEPSVTDDPSHEPSVTDDPSQVTYVIDNLSHVTSITDGLAHDSSDTGAWRAPGLEPFTQGVGRRRSTPGSVAFVPSVAGLILAGEIIKDLLCHNTYRLN